MAAGTVCTHLCPISYLSWHNGKLEFLIFYCIFELKFPHKKSKKQIEAADNRAAGTVLYLTKGKSLLEL